MTTDKEIEEGYAHMSEAEAFDHDLLALVAAARAVGTLLWKREDDSEEAKALREALEQFEPWLDQDEDPRSMGWVDDRGRP